MAPEGEAYKGEFCFHGNWQPEEALVQIPDESSGGS